MWQSLPARARAAAAVVLPLLTTLRVAWDSAGHLAGGRLPSLLASLFVTVHPVY